MDRIYWILDSKPVHPIYPHWPKKGCITSYFTREENRLNPSPFAKLLDRRSLTGSDRRRGYRCKNSKPVVCGILDWHYQYRSGFYAAHRVLSYGQSDRSALHRQNRPIWPDKHRLTVLQMAPVKAFFRPIKAILIGWPITRHRSSLAKILLWNRPWRRCFYENRRTTFWSGLFIFQYGFT